MKKIIIICFCVLFLAASCSQNSTIPAPANPTENKPVAKPTTQTTETKKTFKLPIANALERITKKPFGLQVSPQSSPVSPERFSGYHNAVDFEMLNVDEEKNDVEFMAICSGSILRQSTVSGYGGLLVMGCNINNMDITVNYGHVRLSSLKYKVGEFVEAGNVLGVLGTGYSKETDNERKHLHLGIHKGKTINISGYVKTKQELEDWIDFTKF
jgi:murein DD-endopeptidase MepM/ murein hydrolase activator NlpD